MRAQRVRTSIVMSTELIACEPLRGGFIVHVLFHRLQCPPTWNKTRHQNVCYTRESASQCSQWGGLGRATPRAPSGVLGKETFFSEGLARGCRFRSGDIQKSPLPGSSTLTNLAVTCVGGCLGRCRVCGTADGGCFPLQPGSHRMPRPGGGLHM